MKCTTREKWVRRESCQASPHDESNMADAIIIVRQDNQLFTEEHDGAVSCRGLAVFLEHFVARIGGFPDIYGT